MKLTTDTDVEINSPSKEQIRAAVIEAANRPDGFVILSESNLTYMQTAGDKGKRFTPEYQEGSPANHFRAKEDFSIDEVVELLSSYCRGRAEWKKAATWVPGLITLGKGKHNVALIRLVLVLWAVGCAVMLLSLWSIPPWRDRLFRIGLACICIACCANVASAVFHQSMWGRFSVITPAEFGGTVFFRVMITLYVILAGIFAWGAATFHSAGG